MLGTSGHAPQPGARSVLPSALSLCSCPSYRALATYATAQTVTPDTLTLCPNLSSALPLSRIPQSSSPISLGLSPGSPSFLRPRPPSSTSFYWAIYAPLPPRRKSGYMPTRSPYRSVTLLRKSSAPSSSTTSPLRPSPRQRLLSSQLPLLSTSSHATWALPHSVDTRVSV
jgi:hypothetical protein